MGNLLGARFANRALMPTIGVVLAYSAVLLAGFGALAHQVPSAMLGVFIFGTLVALGQPLQIRLMDVALDAQTLAGALNHFWALALCRAGDTSRFRPRALSVAAPSAAR